MSKRVLICTRSHAPHGGADRIIADLCRHLPERGWQVTLGLTQGARFNDAEHYLDVMGRDLPARTMDGRRGTRAARVAAIRRLVDELQPDVVLSMRVFDAYEAVALAKYASGRGPRLAVGIRSFEAPYLADLRLYRDSVDACITSGQLIADLAVQACGMPADRVTSIGGGVLSPRHPAPTRTPAQPVKLLYAGRLDRDQKRVLDIPPFLDELDRRGIAYLMRIAGTGPAETELRSELATREQAGSVQYLGWVPQDRLYAEVYPDTDCFVHFAAWEGMTIAPREAMAHGVVPIISRFQGLAREGQFVEERTALTFPVGAPTHAANCLQRLMVEPGLMAALSENARESQTGRYSFAGALDAWSESLDRCLEQPVCLGALPKVQERTSGRLSRWGVPESAQRALRNVFGLTVSHASPGSEWPTASGLMTSEVRDELARLGAEADSRPWRADA